MSGETFVVGSAAQLGRLVLLLRRMTFERPWKVTLERVEPRAGTDQEAVLRGIERAISEFTGQDMPSVHDELLAQHYGVERIPLRGGGELVRPARRTRTGAKPLKRGEMRDHIKFAEAFAASLGIELP